MGLADAMAHPIVLDGGEAEPTRRFGRKATVPVCGNEPPLLTRAGRSPLSGQTCIRRVI